MPHSPPHPDTLLAPAGAARRHPDDLLTFAEVAQESGSGVGRDRLRDWCVKAGVAVQVGGTDENPWLKVKLQDAKNVIMRRRYVSPAKRIKRRAGKLNPLVTC